MSIQTFTKDPQAILDYTIDWSDWVATSETISSVSWSVANGLTQSSASNSTTAATIFLSGGTLGVVYRVTVHITTNQSRQDDRSFYVRIANR